MNTENNLNNIVTTPPSPEDVLGIINVFYKTWLATYPNEELGITIEDIEHKYKDRLSEENVAKRAKRIAEPPVNEQLLVAKINNKVIGVCRGIIHENANQLQAIYILPEYQGKGIGGLLWQEINKFFDLNKHTIVEVASYNQNAINFYTKLGFKDTGESFNDEGLKMKNGAVIPQIRMILAN
jgi:ribosomal protein S18 acetylase RimI-like enzyme